MTRVATAVVVVAAAAGPPAAALLVQRYRETSAWLARSVPGLRAVSGSLPEIYPEPVATPAIAALVILAVSTVALLLLGSRVPTPTAIDSSPWPLAPADGWRRDQGFRSWRLLGAGLAVGWIVLLVVFVWSRLALPRSSIGTVAWLGLFLISLILATIADRRFRPWTGLHDRRPLVALMLLMGLIAVWQAWSVSSWRFSCTGDEWALHRAAVGMLATGLLQPDHLFASVTQGVYKVHAPFLSWFQALVMWFAGADNFGWRLSGVIAHALALAPFAVVAGRSLGRAGLAVAVAAYSTSPLMYAEVHSGYGWGQMNLWCLLALAALMTVSARRTARHAVLLGMACAACLLLYGTPVFVPPVALVTLAATMWWQACEPRARSFRSWSRTRVWAMVLVVTAAAVFTVGALLPRLLSPAPGGTVEELRSTLWKTNLGPLVAYYLGADWFQPPLSHVAPPVECARTIGIATVRTLLAPITYQASELYVTGPILDPVAGGLVLVGMVVSLSSRLRRRRSAMVWLFFLPAVAVAGSLSPLHEYGDLRITRLYFLVPFWAVFAGFGTEAVLLALGRRLGAGTSRVALAVIVGVVLCWNVWRIEVVCPRAESPTVPATAMRLLQETQGRGTVWACLDGWHPLDYVAAQYRDGRRLRFVPDDRVAELLDNGLQPDEMAVFVLARGAGYLTVEPRAMTSQYADRLGCRSFPESGRPRLLVCAAKAPVDGADVASGASGETASSD